MRTLEGKARSAKNAIKHGLFAKQLLLPGESAEELQSLIQDHLDQFQPQTAMETRIVHAMAATNWRMNRLANMETNLLSNFLLERSKWMPQELKSSGDDAHVAWAFDDMTDRRPSLTLLIRYKATLSREYDRAFKQLQALQKQRPTPPQPKLQNELSPPRLPQPEPASQKKVSTELDNHRLILHTTSRLNKATDSSEGTIQI